MAIGCKTIANMVRSKSSTEVREMFNPTYLPPEQSVTNSTTNNAASELTEAAISNDTTTPFD
jgi:hypothetical protein